MSWLKKGVKKLSHNFDKAFGKTGKWLIPGVAGLTPTLEASKAVVEGWDHIRTPLAMTGLAAATALSGGTLSGVTGPALYGMIAASAASAAASSTMSNEQNISAKKEADEQRRLEEERLRKDKLLAQIKTSTPSQARDLGVFDYRRQLSSQFKRNMKTRQANNSLGGETSTLA